MIKQSNENVLKIYENDLANLVLKPVESIKLKLAQKYCNIININVRVNLKLPMNKVLKLINDCWMKGSRYFRIEGNLQKMAGDAEFTYVINYS